MRLRSIFAAILGAMMLADSAFALSCARPDLVKTLEDAKASEKLYYILVGKFVSPPPQTDLPETNPKANSGYVLPFNPLKPKLPILTQSYFDGVSLAQSSRRDAPLTRFPVDIETSCAGDWCSSPPSSDRDIIAFVEAREGQAPLLKISPCPYWTFSADAERVKKVRQCLDKTCEPEANDW